jgi:hypothetical protein
MFSRKWIVVWILVVVCVVATGYHAYAKHAISQAVASAGPGETVSTSAQLAELASGIISWLGGIGAIAAYLRTLIVNHVKPGTGQDAAMSAVDWAGILYYSKRYKTSTNEAEKSGLIASATALSDQNMTMLFPKSVAPVAGAKP